MSSKKPLSQQIELTLNGVTMTALEWSQTAHCKTRGITSGLLVSRCGRRDYRAQWSEAEALCVPPLPNRMTNEEKRAYIAEHMQGISGKYRLPKRRRTLTPDEIDVAIRQWLRSWKHLLS